MQLAIKFSCKYENKCTFKEYPMFLIDSVTKKDHTSNVLADSKERSHAYTILHSLNIYFTSITPSLFYSCVILCTYSPKSTFIYHVYIHY